MIDDVVSADGAVAAVIDAADVPRHPLEGERSAVCRRRERRFDRGNGAGQGEFDPCPGRGSPAWVRRGYREGAAFVVGEGRVVTGRRRSETPGTTRPGTARAKFIFTRPP